MCGRYAFYSPKERVKREFDAQIQFDFLPHYNLGPGQEVIGLINQDNKKTAHQISWGMKPTWSKSQSKLLINARAESVHEKSTFKNSFKHQRCIFVADGWYEWLRKDNQKQPYYFYRKDTRLFAFAGIYFDGGDGKLSGILLTCKAPSKIQHIHDRAPLMLTREQVNVWLSNQQFSYVSDSSVDEFDTSIINFHKVSTRANKIQNDRRDLIDKIG